MASNARRRALQLNIIGRSAFGRHAQGPHPKSKASCSFSRMNYRVSRPSCCHAAADLEEAAATGQKLEYGWTSINFLLPAVLLFSDAIFGLAAGMTVKCAAVHSCCSVI